MKALARFCILTFLLIGFSPPYYWANEEPILIEVPLLLNASEIGEVKLAVTSDGKEQVDTKSLTKTLKPRVNASGLALLSSVIGDRTYLPSQLSERDFMLSYDEQDQSLFVTIAFEYLKHHKTSLTQTQQIQVPDEICLNPSPLSGSIDFALDSRLYHFYYNEAPSFSNLNLGTNFALNLKNILIDGYGYLVNYTGGDVKNIAHNLNRGNVRVTKDFVQANCRLQLGDISPSSISFQNTLPLVGISLLNTPNMFNNNNTSFSTVGQHEFMLNAPSKVDVYLNNTYLRTLNLPAGPQQLRNFPYANGVNNVTLKITDPMGYTNELNLETLYTPLKIPPGEFMFDASIGFPRFQEVTQKFKYLFNELMFSGIVGSGVSEHATMQAYFQTMKRDSIFLGSTFLYYNKFLQAGIEVGSSLTKNLPPGVRSRLTLSSPNFDRNRLLAWQCNLDFTSRSFSYLGTKTFVNKEKLMLSASVAAKMPAKINTSLTGYWGLHRMTNPNVWSVQYTLGKAFKYGAGSVVTSYKQLDIGKRVFEMVFNFSFSPRQDTRVASNYNTRTRTSNTYTNYHRRMGPQESLNASAGLATASDRKNFAGSLRYQGPRGDAFVNHYLVESAVLPLASNSKISGTTQINGRTAFFFADNKFCIGRPSTSSFVIVRPEGIAKKYPIYINSSSNEYYMQKSRLPMGSVFPIGNYRTTSFQVDSYEPPPGFKLEQQLYYAKSKNRSAFVATVHIQAFMCAQGYLINAENNEPITYSSGYFLKEGGQEDEKVFFYTNSFGKFFVEELESGSYSVYIDQLSHKPLTVNIQESVNIISLGKLEISLT